MWEAYYGKEPFDLRLTVLRLVRNLHKIIGITLIGTLLFGGGYYIKNVLLNRQVSFVSASVYKVSFVVEPDEPGDYYINEMTWNTFVHSEEFYQAVKGHLDGDKTISSAAELAAMLTAKLDSDVHVPSTIVSTAEEAWTLELAQAVEKAMTGEFAEENEQIASIKVITPGTTAEKVLPDVRPLRAFILSALLSAFFAVILFLLKETGDDCVWLPATLRRRYGLTTLGTVESPEFESNVNYILAQKSKVAVCAMDQYMNPIDAVESLRRATDKTTDTTVATSPQWIPLPAPLTCTESCDVMREADGVVLVVRAGAHIGKPLEYVLEYLAEQKITVTAALLWEADEALIRTYYRLPARGLEQDPKQQDAKEQDTKEQDIKEQEAGQRGGQDK